MGLTIGFFWRRSLFVIGAALASLLFAVLAFDIALLQKVIGYFGSDSIVPILAPEKVAPAAEKLRALLAGLAAVPLIAAVEFLRPARANQWIWSMNTAVDAVWYFMFPISLILVVQPAESMLDGIFSRVTPTEPPLTFNEWAIGYQVATVIVVSDFLGWLNHLVRHKVPLFWEFHKIHHSQERLNAFTTYRVHPGDLIAISIIRYLPFTVLDLTVAAPAFVAWTVFLRTYEMLYHSNIKANFGVLRYLIVTPQSHRLHHSSEPEHRDRNFGNFLSIWDWLFRTQCSNGTVYPHTGVTEKQVPNGGARLVREIPRSIIRELVYPLVQILKVSLGAFKRKTHDAARN